MRLNTLFSVAPRYTRSISLERDIENAQAVAGYVLTPTGRDLLARVSRTLDGEPAHRAWTLTGPYGSGKSAFALLLAALLGGRMMAGFKSARQIVEAYDSGLALKLAKNHQGRARAPFVPVVITGSAAGMLRSVLVAVIASTEAYCPDYKSLSALRAAKKLLARVGTEREVNSSEVVAVVTSLAEEIRKFRFSGFVIIIDELGKFLEFAAQHPEFNDIFVLQQLAEATAQKQVPELLVVTVLHQAFDQYASGLQASLRNEWAKVQGRYEDILFQESPDQILRLISNAIVQKPSPTAEEMRKASKAIAAGLYMIECKPDTMGKRDFAEAVAGCAPLHPITAMILARLFKKFGQNQRSLFSFLTAHSESGFSSFLEQDRKGNPPWYEAADLYDYAAEALGSSLVMGEGATRWAEIAAILDAHNDLLPEEVRIVKTVGLLSALGAYKELKPSNELLELYFGPRFQALIKSLKKRSILVYRRHSASYALWQGSDIDIDERLAEAARRVSPTGSLANRLNQRVSVRPLVAKRHSFETGTLRFFEIKFADMVTFSSSLEATSGADGMMIYALPNGVNELHQLRTLAGDSRLRDRVDVLIAVPNSVQGLSAAFRELELLRWVEANTPELQGDAIARRELRARLAAAEEATDRHVAQLFDPSHARDTTWFHHGIRIQVPTARFLSQLLSDICDSVYEESPRIKNELLNRRTLSSAAAKARRILIEHLITNPGVERLGIEGNPPELSMYRSLIEASGIHRPGEHGPILCPPKVESSLYPAWQAIEKFVTECELRKQSVIELFKKLQAPPFGMKMGPIPVLFCAAALVRDSEIALYEGGAFVAELSVDVFERLLRSPQTFEMRSYRVEGVRRAVFSEYSKLLGAAQSDGASLLTVVKPLFRFFNRLPEYVKRTDGLSPQAIAVREALFASRDPDILLFNDLPIACGLAPFDSGLANKGSVSKFFESLRASLGELQRCYDDLLSHLQQLLFQAFGESGGDGRKHLQQRATRVQEYAVEPKMKALMMHLTVEDLEEAQWIEAIATLLTAKPPKNWHDADRARFEVSVSELSRSFRHIEAMVFELQKSGVERESNAEVFRIGVMDQHTREAEAVVSVRGAQKFQVTEAVLDIEKILQSGGIAESPDLALAALAIVSRNFLAELDKTATSKATARVKA
jgi:hypothetical protein